MAIAAAGYHRTNSNVYLSRVRRASLVPEDKVLAVPMASIFAAMPARLAAGRDTTRPFFVRFEFTAPDAVDGNQTHFYVRIDNGVCETSMDPNQLQMTLDLDVRMPARLFKKIAYGLVNAQNSFGMLSYLPEIHVTRPRTIFDLQAFDRQFNRAILP